MQAIQQRRWLRVADAHDSTGTTFVTRSDCPEYGSNKTFRQTTRNVAAQNQISSRVVLNRLAACKLMMMPQRHSTSTSIRKTVKTLLGSAILALVLTRGWFFCPELGGSKNVLRFLTQL